MFGSNPFGQSSTSPFGSQPVFGQTNNAANNNNPFAPKPFGGSNPFGQQTGSSIFGGMSTGVFGSQSSSPLGSTSVFGASSSPAFGNSAPTFGASTGASPFGQPKPAFGFGTNTTPTSPFGQQSQPAFGSSPFGAATPFSAPSQPAFGASSSSPAFGTPSVSPFGGTTTSAFGSTASPGFGSTPFGSAPAFGVTPTSSFGGTASAFGTTPTTPFGATTPGFGSTPTPAFGQTTSAPAFGNSTPAFNFGSSPGFGQSASTFGNSTFGTSSFGPQSSAFGVQASTPTFAQSTFGGQRVGSRAASYTSTPEVDAGTGTPGKLESISAMAVYKDKSHEELRWEDYQAGDKGGPSPAGQSTSLGSAPSTLFGQSSANPFSSSTPTNPFAPKTPVVNNSAFGSSPATGFGSSPFGQSNTSNLFGSTSSATSSLFGPTTQAFGVNTSSPSLFNSGGTSGFGSQSIFNSTPQGATATFGTGLGFGNSQSSPSLFQSSTPALTQTTSPFAQNTSAFGQTNPAFGQTAPAFGQQPSLFNASSSGFGSFFSSSSSLLSNSNPAGFGQTAPSLTTPFQSAQPAQSSGGFSFSNFGQTQAAASSGFGGMPGLFGQNTFGQSLVPQSNVVTQAAPIINPFGTLPAMPQMSIGRPGSSPSIQYGISSLPVVEKPVAPRISSLLTSRHISQRRMGLPIRRYHPNTDGPKVPFFNDDQETPSTPKADALFVPRENPRALVIRPLEQWPSRSSAEKMTPSKVKGTYVHENGMSEESMGRGLTKELENPVNGHEKTNGNQDGGPHTGKGDSFVTLTGHRAGEAAIVYEHGADIEALMPKLRHSDYYTEPRIQEIAAKERAQPGYCRQVKDFVVGRHGYGSIKFFGETDVRRLDLESLVQFNNREVIVYMDESKKPPIGQGLNKPAEVTLLNIKCVDKKSGQQYTEGARVEKYKEMLKRKAEDQGAEFVSYDPAKGEWKFRVHHFSGYKLTDEDESDEYL